MSRSIVGSRRAVAPVEGKGPRMPRYASFPRYGAARVVSAPRGRQPNHSVVHVDGHPLSVWSRVPKQPTHVILLVHGRTWSALPNFDLQAPGVQRSVMKSLKRHAVATYAVDLRGYGSTPGNANHWNTHDQAANDVAEVLMWIRRRHPDLEGPTLLGWSLGALVSHRTAQQCSGALSDLILYGYPRDPADSAVPSWPAEPLRVANTREDARKDFISTAVVSEALVERYVDAVLEADPIRTDWKELDQYRLLDPARIRSPTLVIHGAHDPLTPLAAQARLFVGLGTEDKHWVVLAGGNHAAMLEDTHEAFIAAIVAFVKRPRLWPR